MKVLYSIAWLLILLSCFACVGEPGNECEEISYSQSSDNFSIVSRFVFDTSASLFRATVTDYATSAPIMNARLLFEKDQVQKEITTVTSGEAEIFEDGFSGIWQLTVTHDDYRCLIVNDVEIGGGQLVNITLKHK